MSTKTKLLFLLLIVLVTLLFFVHSHQGGFQSKNGPTTPINNLRFVIAILLLALAGKRLSVSLFAFRRTILAFLLLPPLHSPVALTGSTSLRC
jgi:hypothetical protein